MNKKAITGTGFLLMLIICGAVALIVILKVIPAIREASKPPTELGFCTNADPDYPCNGKPDGTVIDDPTGVCNKIICRVYGTECTYECVPDVS
ncbi:MAG: hypothetical protein ABIA93_02795 [Candidatus Woesearchaeota archaeon]